MCNSSANSLLELISFLIDPPEADLSHVGHIAKVSDRVIEVDVLN